MSLLVKDQRSLMQALRETCESAARGAARLPSEANVSLNGVSYAYWHIELSTAILEIVDDYETQVLGKIATSFREKARDDLVQRGDSPG